MTKRKEKKEKRQKGKKTKRKKDKKTKRKKEKKEKRQKEKKEMKTRITNVVRNAGCSLFRYTEFFFNQLMN